jgi:mono/diheme cytochrome c family protein
MKNRRCRFAIGFAMSVALVSLDAEGEDNGAASRRRVVEVPAYRIDRDLRKQLADGITITFRQSASDGAPVVDTRNSRLAALYVAPGSSASAFLVPGPFAATFDGFLKLKLKTECTISFAGRGKAKLLINDTPVLAAEGGNLGAAGEATVALGKYNRLRIQYENPPEGAAEFRLYWRSAEFAHEPVPPGALKCNGVADGLTEHEQLRTGRELFANHGCHKCHTAALPKQAVNGQMPEMFKAAPSLADAGSRLQPDWLSAWILKPHALRNKVTMPALIPDADRAAAKREAADIAAFVGGLKSNEAKSKLPSGDAKAGAELFENLGCIACHYLTADGDKPDELERVSLRHVPVKFQNGQLARFLLNPRQHYLWSRMPDFHLTGGEATALESYIRQEADGRLANTGAMPAADASRGKTSFLRRGCANCHSTGINSIDAGEKLVVAGPTAEAKGCLADVKSRGASPGFEFDDATRAALVAFLQTDRSSLGRSSTAEVVRRQMRQLNCVACHRLDSLDSDLAYAIEEFGSGKPQDDLLPILTFAGERLHTAWTERLLAGKLEKRSRPWLKTRMPSFPARATIFSHGLAAQHGFGTTAQIKLQVDQQKAEIGRRLTVKDGGFDCIQCHSVGGQPPTATFDARGVNLYTTAKRVRHEYFGRWMLNPQRFDPTTKMPRYSMDGKKTSLGHVFEGDAGRQFDALWHYIQSLRNAPRPSEKSTAGD